METQERQGHGNQGSNVGDHMYIAQDLVRKKQESHHSMRPLADPIKTDLVVKWR